MNRDTQETSSALQGADSSIPEEGLQENRARVRRRPGTRLQTAPRRPEPSEPSRGPSAPASPAPAQWNGARAILPPRPAGQQVGYAPGRMSEGETRQIPRQEEVRRDLNTREARAYLERRKQPIRDEEPPRREPPIPRTNPVLPLVVILLLVAGFVLVGLLALRGLKDGDPAQRPEPARVQSFIATLSEDAVAPTDITVSVNTVKEVTDLRLTDGSGQEVRTEKLKADNAEGTSWILTMHVENGYEDTLTLETRRDDEDWQKTDRTLEVIVHSPLPTAELPSPAETVTPEISLSDASLPPEVETWVTSAPEEASSSSDDLEAGEAPATEPESLETAEARDGEEPETTEAAEDWDGEEPETADIGEDSEQSDPENQENPEVREAGTLRTVEPTSTPAPETREEPTATPPLTAEAAPEANPDLIVQTDIYTSGKKKEKEYSRPAKELIHMPVASEYTRQNMGVLTFRGDNFRRNAAAGSLSAAPTGLEVAWSVEAGSARGVNQTYYGYGWPGQPAIVKWSRQVRAASNLYESKLDKANLKEVIIAGLDGAIRFLDLEDGSLTRNSIKLGYPMRGTPSLHPLGEPFMSVGQFARKMKAKTGKIGLRQYNLYTQKELKLLDGLDGKLNRPLNDVGSFNTSALVDRTSDTLITVGTNGMLYLEALNSAFDWQMGVLSISPSVTVMTSRARNQRSKAVYAVESSLAAYDRYVYYADMGGVLRCVDTNILTPVWAVETGDAVMAAIALDLTEDRQLNLYTANMLTNRKKGDGQIQIRRLDALSGREAWCTDVGVYKGKKDQQDVGAKASPVIGENALSQAVYFTVTGLSEEGRHQLGLPDTAVSALLSLDRDTGAILWAFGMESRSESSPVAVYDGEGNGWLIQCEENGTVHLLEGLSGSETASLKLEAEIEASPAVYNGRIVLGTTGRGTSFVYAIDLRTDGTERKE